MRWWAIGLSLVCVLVMNCGPTPTQVTTEPARLTVPDSLPQMSRAIVELDIEDWQEVICVRMFPAQPQRYTCFTAGFLRQRAQPTLKAN